MNTDILTLTKQNLSKLIVTAKILILDKKKNVFTFVTILLLAPVTRTVTGKSLNLLVVFFFGIVLSESSSKLLSHLKASL